MKKSDVLIKARDLLITKGWVKNEFVFEGRFCAVGAIEKVVGFHDHSFVNEVKECLRVVVGGEITTWNDSKNRRKKDVINVFTVAASIAMSEEALETK